MEEMSTSADHEETPADTVVTGSYHSEDDEEINCEINSDNIRDNDRNRSNSGDSNLVNDIENFFGAMENELEEILSGERVEGGIMTEIGSNREEVHTAVVNIKTKSEPILPSQPPQEDQSNRTFLSEDGWTLYYSQEGYPYYYNSKTQESEWAPVEDETLENTDDTMLKSLEGISPSPNKRPLDRIRNIDGNIESESPSTAPSNQSSLLSTAKGSLSAVTATATTYGKTLFSVAASTASTYLKQPTAENQANIYQSFLNHPDSVELTIPARSSTKVPFILKKGFSFLCTVLVKDYDLGIALRERKMTDGGGVEVDLHPLIKCLSGAPYNVTDPISLNEANEIQTSRNIILVLDNSYSTFRSKSCIYRIHQVESSEINSLLDIPNTVQFNEFFDDMKGDENELDQSTVTEQSTDDDDREGEQDEITRRLTRVELIPLSVASNQKMKIVDGKCPTIENNEFHMSDFHTSDDDDTNYHLSSEALKVDTEVTEEQDSDK